MDCRELEKNQLIESLLKENEAVDNETIDFVNNLSNPDNMYSVLICDIGRKYSNLSRDGCTNSCDLCNESVKNMKDLK